MKHKALFNIVCTWLGKQSVHECFRRLYFINSFLNVKISLRQCGPMLLNILNIVLVLVLIRCSFRGSHPSMLRTVSCYRVVTSKLAAEI